MSTACYGVIMGSVHADQIREVVEVSQTIDLEKKMNGKLSVLQIMSFILHDKNWENIFSCFISDFLHFRTS